jgi:hypothetical protein
MSEGIPALAASVPSFRRKPESREIWNETDVWIIMVP